MIAERYIGDYKTTMLQALELAKTHDCKYYVIQYYTKGENKFECLSEPEEGMKIVGYCYPGGRMVASGLGPNQGTLLR